MPRKKTGETIGLAVAKGNLAEKLATELKSGRDHGQPLIWEQEFRTGKLRVTVIWDLWAGIRLQERTATILRAYELAEGAEYRNRIALASGVTFPEAYVAGMLPYRIILAWRKDDAVTKEQALQAMLKEGASKLISPDEPQLRFATKADAEAARQRLCNRLPKSEAIWMIIRETTAQDFAEGQDDT